MLEAIIVIVGGVINRLRGWSPTDHVVAPTMRQRTLSALTDRPTMALAMGVMFGLYAQDWTTGIVVAGGWWLWSVFGWGDYFDFSQNKNSEIAAIDHLTRRVSQPWRDVFSMSLRSLFMYPLFAGLAIHAESLLPLVAGTGVVMFGPIWYVWHLIDRDDKRKIKTIGAELSIGAITSALLLIAINEA